MKPTTKTKSRTPRPAQVALFQSRPLPNPFEGLRLKSGVMGVVYPPLPGGGVATAAQRARGADGTVAYVVATGPGVQFSVGDRVILRYSQLALHYETALESDDFLPCYAFASEVLAHVVKDVPRCLKQPHE